MVILGAGKRQSLLWELRWERIAFQEKELAERDRAANKRELRRDGLLVCSHPAAALPFARNSSLS
jgi:hypothetical protein